MSDVEMKVMLGNEASEVDPDGVNWPFDTLVLYAYAGDKIVGRVALVNLPVIEGTYVAEEYRGTTLAVRMQKEIEKMLLDLGKTHAMAMAADETPEIRNYLRRFGYEEMPVTFHTKQLVQKVKAA